MFDITVFFLKFSDNYSKTLRKLIQKIEMKHY